MKSRRLTISSHLTMTMGLVVAGLLAACSGQQAPTQPDSESTEQQAPVLGHKGGHNPGGGGGGDGDGNVGTFVMTFSGAVSGVVGPFDWTVSGGTNQVGSTGTLTLSQELIDALDPDGFGCFAHNPFTGPIHTKEPRRDRGAANTQFFFNAIGTDGSFPQQHLLKMAGTHDGGPWPPEAGTSNTITGYRLFIDGKSNSPKCRGELSRADLFQIVVARTH